MRLKRTVRLPVALLVAALSMAGARASKADVVTCSTGPGCLNGSDSFDWANNYGPEFSDIPNGSAAVSNSGALTATVNFGGGGDGLRMDQGSGWNGNFNPGEALLWTNSPGQGPITFTFSQLLTGLGTNIQADFLGPFTAFLQVFDSHGNLIDSVSQNGDSNPNGDGSAIFIGLANEVGIASATFSLTSCPCDTTDFAIGSLDVAPVPTSVPEPSSCIPLATGFGLAGLSGYLRRRRKLAKCS
jgi:hypothetical protein